MTWSQARLAVILCTLVAMGKASPDGLGRALTGYDCEDRKASTQVLDLTAPGRCPNAETDYIEPPVWKQAAVVHQKKYGSVKITNCNFRITREAVKCGFDSLTYAPR